ncbi:MAG: hypothetical protein M3511_10820 [Deinococcota bacterium]|nr:hypothetical protein [Deinococcota bacterium]
MKRKTSIEGSVDELVETEFKMKDGSYDLRVSVYAIALSVDKELVQTCAEHTAGNDLNPGPKGTLDLTDAASTTHIKQTPTQNKIFDFTYTSSVHHEVEFRDEGMLRSYLDKIFEDIANRSRNVGKRAITTYAYVRYSQNDDEWLEVCQLSADVKQWVLKGKP